jgi:glycosyltransferase involved in cell wall biosynthesis
MKIHLVNPMEDRDAGTELHTLNLYRLLSQNAEVTVWSQTEPDRRLADLIPIKRIYPRRGRIPVGGTIIFVGFYYPIGRWAGFALNRRRILVCNTDHLPSFENFYNRISLHGRRKVELVHTSEAIMAMIGRPGWICPSPIDITQYHYRDRAVLCRGPFTVGRHSRDHRQKHHEQAPEFYARLLAAGCRIRVLGGTSLRDRLPAQRDLDLLPVGAETSPVFLDQLDCFYYRTNEIFFEAYGRVVFEAMASGVPVVVHRRGGYAEFLTHGVDALLFDTDDEAFDLIMRLRSHPELRARISRNARKRVEQIYSQEWSEQLRRYYLS